MLYNARHASPLGLCVPQAEADWALVQAHVRQVQEIIRGGSPEQARAGIAAQGVDLFMGEAMFISLHEIRVNGETLRGAIRHPRAQFLIPEIEAVGDGLYNKREACRCRAVKTLGGDRRGPIGPEFAQMFSRFGAGGSARP
jgi:pyruvate/2-oxoglutarate dehydrogenase complex dihydrolipoamide dehydrogenase (E3) component